MQPTTTIEQDLVHALLSVANLYRMETGKQFSTIGREACNNSTMFEGLMSGKSCTIRIYSDLMQYFSERWPDGVPWPADVKRPSPRKQPATSR